MARAAARGQPQQQQTLPRHRNCRQLLRRAGRTAACCVIFIAATAEMSTFLKYVGTPCHGFFSRSAACAAGSGDSRESTLVAAGPEEEEADDAIVSAQKKGG